MKNGKAPTRGQKKIMRAHGLVPENWLVVKNLPDTLEVVSRTALKKIGRKPRTTVKGMFITHDDLHHLKSLCIPASLHHDLILVFTGATGCKEIGVLHALILHEITNIPCHCLIRWYLLPFVDVGYGVQLLIKHLTGVEHTREYRVIWHEQHNLIFLDGTWSLDGSKIIDAWQKTEVL